MKHAAEPSPTSKGGAGGPLPAGLRSRDLPRGLGLAVIGHGTANATGAAETAEIAATIGRLLPNVPVELGYLEVIEPSIDIAVERLAARGCREILALPLLLFAAGHAKRDVPAALTAAACRRGLAVRQAAPLGLHPEIVTLMRQRYLQTVADLPPAAGGEAVLVVGRGSSDPTAAAQLWAVIRKSFATVRRLATAPVRIGFVAAARPTLDEAIAELSRPQPGRPGIGRVVVQPHLLFRGHVESQIADRLHQARAAHPEVEWLQVPRLGAAAEVARALIDRGIEAVRDNQPGRS